jgi:hypothetical protein
MGANEWFAKGDRCLEDGSRIEGSVCLTEGLIVLAYAIGLYTKTRWSGTHFAVAGAADSGRFADGFSTPYAVACDVDLDVASRLAAAHRACDVLRSFFDAQGTSSEVRTVEELLR